MFKGRITCITTVVGYNDYFALTLPWNTNHFDEYICVTSNRKEDEQVRETCRRHHVRCLMSDDHERDGPFSKGRMIERGLQLASQDTWICHLDADIILPQTFRKALDRAHLQSDTLYGCDRFMIEDYKRYQEFLASGWLLQPHTWHPAGVSPPKGFDIGSRWCGDDGYVPIGFFQLWDRLGGQEEWRGSRTKRYPHFHGNAARSDVQHGLAWDRKKRELIPELYVAHLGSDTDKPGANWNGRVTPRFGPVGKVFNGNSPS